MSLQKEEGKTKTDGKKLELQMGIIRENVETVHKNFGKEALSSIITQRVSEPNNKWGAEVGDVVVTFPAIPTVNPIRTIHSGGKYPSIYPPANSTLLLTEK